MFSKQLVLIGLSLCVCVPLGAVAEEAPLTEREKSLLEMVKKLEARVEALEKREQKKASPKLEERTGVIEEQAKEREPEPSDMRVYWKGGIRMDTEDKRIKLRIGGRIQNDWAWFSQDRDLEHFFGNAQDATEFRRARIYISGLLYGNIAFKSEYNFSDGDVEFKDVYLAMSDLPVVGNVKLGHIKEPFSLEELTSSKYITFMERALPNALVQGRNTGVLFYDQVLDDRMTWALGFFRTADDFGDGSDDGDYAVTARVTGLPWYADGGRKLLHLGVGYSHHSRNGALRFDEKPESHLSDFSYIDTGIFETDDMKLLGLETAFKYGPFSLQSEYVRSDVSSVRRKDFGFFVGRDEVMSASMATM